MSNVEARDRELYKAVVDGNVQLIQKLTAVGVNIEQWAYEEWDEDLGEPLTPLQKAVHLRNQEIVQLLLQAPADTHNWKQAYISHALDVAARLGDLEMVQILLLFLANKVDEYVLNPALSNAAWGGNVAVVQVLLKAGADVNTLDPGSETPLMTAARTGNLDLVKLLVEAGADPNTICDESPFTGALGMAAISGHQEVFDYLFTLVTNQEERVFAQEELTKVLHQKKVEKTPNDELLISFFNAVFQKNIDAVRNLFSAGVNVNSYGQGGIAAIHQAAINGNFSIINLLIELGADVNIPNQDTGETPLMMAVIVQNAWTMRALIRKGADVNAKDMYGNTALDLAEDHPCAHPVLKKILLKAGAIR